MREMEYFMATHPTSQTAQLGKKIRIMRKQLGLTQEQLAEILGVGHQALSRIEQGHMAPKMDRLPALAEALQCTVSDLFRPDDDSQSTYADRLADLFSGLPTHKQEFVFQHIASLVFLLKMDE